MSVPKDELCTCGTYPKGEPSPCPYAQDINDDDSPCECCDRCKDDCAMDV